MGFLERQLEALGHKRGVLPADEGILERLHCSFGIFEIGDEHLTFAELLAKTDTPVPRPGKNSGLLCYTRSLLIISNTTGRSFWPPLDAIERIDLAGREISVQTTWPNLRQFTVRADPPQTRATHFIEGLRAQIHATRTDT